VIGRNCLSPSTFQYGEGINHIETEHIQSKNKVQNKERTIDLVDRRG